MTDTCLQLLLKRSSWLNLQYKWLIVNCLPKFTLLRHQYSAVAHILTHSVNLAFGPESGLKNKCWAWDMFGHENEGRLQLWLNIYFLQKSEDKQSLSCLYPGFQFLIFKGRWLITCFFTGIGNQLILINNGKLLPVCFYSINFCYHVIVYIVFHQEAPFVVIRLYVMIASGIMKQSSVFFVGKNILVIALQIYCIIVLQVSYLRSVEALWKWFSEEKSSTLHHCWAWSPA